MVSSTSKSKRSGRVAGRPSVLLPGSPGWEGQGYRLGIPQTRTRSSEAESAGLGTVQTPGQVSPALKEECSCPADKPAGATLITETAGYVRGSGK